MFTSIQKQLELIDEADKKSAKKKIIILGAGMAGLSAAFELQTRGHNVTVYEGNSRVGGRVWTHRFKSGQYHEYGAMRIPASHDFTRHYIQKFGLRLRPFVTAHNDKDCFYYINGKVTTIEDAFKILLPEFKLAPFKKKMILQKKQAPSIFGYLIDKVLESLTYDDMFSLFGESTKFTDTIKKLDNLSLDKFLDEMLDTKDAKDLIYKTTGISEFADYSILIFLRDELIGTGNGLEEIVGGMDLLPNALANNLLPGTIKFSTEVKGIINKSHTVEINYITRKETDSQIPSEEETVSADYVICTIPYSKLRNGINVQGVSAEKENAIRNLSYAESTKVLLHSRRRFWETDYAILGGASISDEVTKQTYYPSDNILNAPNETVSDYTGLYTFYSFDKGEIKDLGVSRGPGVIVGSYCWGNAAKALGSLSPDQRKEEVIKVIENFHPEIRMYIDDHASVYWDDEEWAQGAFSFMKPKELTTIYHDAIKPEGNLFFAGEHCSVEQAWIQGALISSLRVVEEVLHKGA